MMPFFDQTVPTLDVETTNESRIQREVVKILLRAAIFTGLIMGVIFLLQYEVEDARPNSNVAAFTFIMAFVFTMLVWAANIVVINFRILPFVFRWLNPRFEFVLRIVTSLMVSSCLMLVWARFDELLGMESRSNANIYGLMQVRGLVIVAISLTLTWGIGQALSQQRAMSLIIKLREENFQAKFEALKQQINPHFLFNSLNILKGMMRTHDQQAEQYLIKLAEVYRYVLQSNTRDAVTVLEELSVLEAYFFMIEQRFRDAISLRVELSASVKKSSIPPLTFQILAENCVKHNVLTKNKPLTLEIFEENGFIIVRNNVQPKNALEASNQVGLSNLTQRYQHLGEASLEVVRTPQYFIVKLPILPALQS